MVHLKMQSVKVSNTLLRPLELQFDVLQGSILGPILYLCVQTQLFQSYSRTVG